MLRDFVLDRFRRNVVAGVEDQQIFDAADNAPVSSRVHFALIAGVKPGVAEDARGFFGMIPVPGKNVRAADDDFFVVGDFYLDATNRRAHTARFNWNARIVQGADSGRFREAVGLQHRDAEHQEKLLRFGRERRRTTYERAKVRTEAFFDLAENKSTAERQPKR